jgi:protocatechuate 3,4-dioxygenase beta subunit
MKCILCLFLLNATTLAAQPDTSVLLKQVSAKLSNGSSVSNVLTDKAYLPIHPQTAFRELIRKHSNTGILKIATAEEPGKKIKVLCTIKNKNGQPVSNAEVYLYQTDARGWYAADAPHVSAYEGDMRHARLFGYVKTDKNGQFELHTVKPSGYPRSDLPAHIHVHVWAKGYSNYVNEFLFDDDDRLVGNIREQSVRNRFQISKPEKATAGFDQQFSYTIVLTD